MRMWKKGAVVGGLWGLVSLPILSLSFGLRRIPIIQFLRELLGIPFTISIKILSIFIPELGRSGLNGHGALVEQAIGVFFGIPLSILIGALLGSIIFVSIEKFRMQRLAE